MSEPTAKVSALPGKALGSAVDQVVDPTKIDRGLPLRVANSYQICGCVDASGHSAGKAGPANYEVGQWGRVNPVNLLYRFLDDASSCLRRLRT